MAAKTTVTLEDDLDGGPADETARFRRDGAEYEIDLNNKNARRSAGGFYTNDSRGGDQPAAGSHTGALMAGPPRELQMVYNPPPRLAGSVGLIRPGRQRRIAIPRVFLVPRWAWRVQV
jgi:Lsr2